MLDQSRVRNVLLTAEGALEEGHANCGDDSVYFEPLVRVRIALAEDKGTPVHWVGPGLHAYVVRVRTAGALRPVIVAGFEGVMQHEHACREALRFGDPVSAAVITHVSITQGSRSPFARAIF